MSQAVQAVLPWIVMALAAAIFIPGVIDYLRQKERGAAQSKNRFKEEQATWMMEGIALGMAAGYWTGRALGNSVLGLALGVLIGMLVGCKIQKKQKNTEDKDNEETL